MKLIVSVLGDATGGRWKVVVDYVKVLVEAGHDVLLILNSKKIPEDFVFTETAQIQMIRNSGHYDLIATLNVSRLIGRFKPDAIICHCGRSATLMKRASFARAPVIAVNHSNNVKRTVCADAYFNISTHIGRLIAEFPAAAGKPGYHIPNMVDFSDDVSWVEPTRHNPVKIGAFGRFDVVKGLHVFVESLGILKKQGVSFTAQLGGDGIQKEELLGLIARHHLEDNLVLTGWVANPQQFFQQNDIFCIPALSDAFGITPLEAAIAGIPLVVSDAEGHRDMFVDGEHVLFAPRGDSIALANALKEMIDDPQRAQFLSKNAFDRVTSTYSKKNFSSSILAALDEVVSACE